MHLSSDNITKVSLCQEIIKAYDKRVVNTDDFTSFGEILQIPKIDNYYKNLNTFVDDIVIDGKKIKYKDLVGLYSKYKLLPISDPELIGEISAYNNSLNEIEFICTQINKNIDLFVKDISFWKDVLSGEFDLSSIEDFKNSIDTVLSLIAKIEANLQTHGFVLSDFIEIYKNKDLFTFLDTNFEDFLLNYSQFEKVYFKIQNNPLYQKTTHKDVLGNFKLEKNCISSLAQNSILKSSQAWQKIISLSTTHKITDENLDLIAIKSELGSLKIEFPVFLKTLLQSDFWNMLLAYKEIPNLLDLQQGLIKMKQKFELEKEINCIYIELNKFFKFPEALNNFDNLKELSSFDLRINIIIFGLQFLIPSLRLRINRYKNIFKYRPKIILKRRFAN